MSITCATSFLYTASSTLATSTRVCVSPLYDFYFYAGVLLAFLFGIFISIFVIKRVRAYA